MRLSILTSLVAGCLVLASCRSSTETADVLSIAPSRDDVTSSVSATAGPVPSASVGSVSTSTPVASSQALPSSNQTLAWSAPVQPNTTLAAAMPAMRPSAPLNPTAPMAGSSPRAQVYSQRFRDAKPINFGRASPRDHAVHGVDISRWQGDIDWPKLRSQGANFAYIKATDGGDHLDPMFRTNWKRAKDAGLKRGAYHFFYWCRVASDQASWFIRNVPRDPDALPPVIDVEWNGESSCKKRPSPEKVREKMQVFMDMLERHYGKRPVIYTAPDFYRDNLRGAFNEYPFWLRSVAAHPSKVYPGRKWMFWQYSGSGLSHGVDGKIDLNVFHGSVNEWHRWTEGGQALARN